MLSLRNAVIKQACGRDTSRPLKMHFISQKIITTRSIFVALTLNFTSDEPNTGTTHFHTKIIINEIGIINDQGTQEGPDG